MIKFLYHPRAVKFLRKIPKKDAERILQTIENLENRSSNQKMDIKKLVNSKNSLRLRVGNIRVIYEFVANTIYIHQIDFRGNVY